MTARHGSLDTHSTSSKLTLLVDTYKSVYTSCSIAIDQLLNGKPLPPSKDGRKIPLAHDGKTQLLDERTGKPYISNSIRSSRYTIYDFVPKQIIFQATRLSNFYFIVIGIPQTIPGFSTTGNYTTILPLVFFMLLTIIKEGYDDFRRHRLDQIENKSIACVFRDHNSACSNTARWWTTLLARLSVKRRPLKSNGVWSEVYWQDIQVGDKIRLKKGETFPADVILINTSSEDAIAYIETIALDGETNLKSRHAPHVLSAYSLAEVKTTSAIISVEDPNRDLYNFDGRIDNVDKLVPLTPQEIVYRGSVLKNTDHAIGLVINTGEECKIRMNANHHPDAKKPRLERYSNHIVLTLIVYVILLSVGCSIGYLVWQNTTEQKSWYLDDAAVPFKEIIIGYGIMFNNVIPLAMYVSLEIVKIGQVLLMNSDINFYDPVSNRRLQSNTNTILENLGQVSYILTDKTGTLTENIMNFRGISIGGHAFFYHSKSEERIVDSNKDTELSTTHESISKPVIVGKEPVIKVNEVDAESSASRSASEPSKSDDQMFSAFKTNNTAFSATERLLHHIRSQPTTNLAKQARQFILAMALCNTCIPCSDTSEDNDYQAASPDEVALVRAAKELGFILAKRDRNTIKVSINTDGFMQYHEYKVLNVIEFSSKRKRMSIILRCPNNDIWLLCKGADNVIIPRLEHADTATRRSREIRYSTAMQRDRQRRSAQLVRRSMASRPSMSMRPSMEIRSLTDEYEMSNRKTAGQPPVHLTDISESESFDRCFQHLEHFAVDGLRTLMFAQRTISPSEYNAWKKLFTEASTSLQDRQHQIEAAGEKIEQSLQLLGVTAIEDKLQDEVPQTIEKLRRAGIRVWMLTGDKRETAINVAHAAKLCRPESSIYVLDDQKGDLEGQLQSALEEISSQRDHNVLVIDGHTLSAVEQSAPLQQIFMDCIPYLDSAICCRASPAQKAYLVRATAAQDKGTLTLAVGDGANDISMIQTAHVGVGVFGKEGLQATRVADYSVARFSHLQRLLFVHGRWNYIRTAKFILWTFWKEMFFYMMQALFQHANGYSGSSLYENWSLTALNTLFTSLCVILPGIFEQDLTAETLLAVPELYNFGQKNRGLNLPVYLLWMFIAALEGVAVWCLSYTLFGFIPTSDNGAFALGNLCFTLAILWTNWKLLMIETHSKTIVIIVGFLITVAGWWIWNIFLAGVYSNNLSPFDVRGGLFSTYGRDWNWWLILIIILTILALFDLCTKAARKILMRKGLWPLWPLKNETAASELGSVSFQKLEAWQELEQTPGALARLMAHRDDGL